MSATGPPLIPIALAMTAFSAEINWGWTGAWSAAGIQMLQLHRRAVPGVRHALRESDHCGSHDRHGAGLDDPDLAGDAPHGVGRSRLWDGVGVDLELTLTAELNVVGGHYNVEQ